MSIQTAQQYIVHLDVQAMAGDPAEAVRAALEQVQRGGSPNVTWRVEVVGESVADGARPIGAYGGEFLG